jgi:hypothetical protein
MDALPIGAWSNYLSVQAEAAATLTGLVFVAVSINLGHPRTWGITRIIQTQLATVPFCFSGILLLRGSPAGLYWLAPGLIFSLAAGVASAWILLVEILR